MTKLNYQYKILEEKLIKDKKVLKVNDSTFDKLIFMEFYKEADASDWNLNSKLEAELSFLKDKKEIYDYFVNDDFSLNIKSYYKVFEEFDFENNAIDLVDKEEVINEPLLVEEKEVQEEIKQTDKINKQSSFDFLIQNARSDRELQDFGEDNSFYLVSSKEIRNEESHFIYRKGPIYTMTSVFIAIITFIISIVIIVIIKS